MKIAYKLSQNTDDRPILSEGLFTIVSFFNYKQLRNDITLSVIRNLTKTHETIPKFLLSLTLTLLALHKQKTTNMILMI